MTLLPAAPPPSLRPGRSLLTGLLGWALLVACVSLLWSRPAALLAVLLLLSAGALLRARSLELTGWWVAAALLGPGGELVAVAAGAWSYAGWTLLPPWLVPAWGLAGVCLALVTDGARGLLRATRGEPGAGRRPPLGRSDGVS